MTRHLTLRTAALLSLALAGSAATADAQSRRNSSPKPPPPPAIPGEDQVLRHWSLFNENYKATQFEMALPDGRWLVFSGKEVGPNNYMRLATTTLHQKVADTYLRVGQLRTATGPNVLPAYIDSVMQVYQLAVRDVPSRAQEFTLAIAAVYDGQKHDIPKAIEYYQKGIDMGIATADWRYTSRLAYLYKEDGQVDKGFDIAQTAYTAYSNASKSDTSQVRAAREMERLMTRGGLITNPDSLITAIRGKTDTGSRNLLLTLLISQKQYEEALPIARQLAEGQNTESNWRLYGALAMQAGKYPEALTAYDKARAMNPNEPSYTFYVAEVYKQQGDLAKARDLVKALPVTDSTMAARLHMFMGALYETAMEKAVASKPGGVGAWGKNFTFDEQLIYQLAVNHYQMAAQADPDHAAQAQERIQTLSPYLPKLAFYEKKKLTPGSAAPVSAKYYGWVNEPVIIPATDPVTTGDPAAAPPTDAAGL